MFFTQHIQNMYEVTDSFDPNSIVQPPQHELSPPPLLTPNTTHYTFEEHNNNNPNLSAEELSSAAIEIQLQNHLQMAFDTHLLHDSSNHLLSFNSSLPDSSYTPTPDLLSLYHLSKCSSASFLPNSSISFNTPPLSFPAELPMADTASASSIVCDPLLYLNLPPQPPLIRDLFQSLPTNGYSLFGSGGDDQIEATGGGGLYQDFEGEEQIENGVTEFNFNMGSMGKGRKAGKGTKQFVNDRERRSHVSDTYQILRNLVPKPTKKDRASIVDDAIKYIKELMRSVSDLRMLVEKKRCAKDRNKRLKTEEDSMENGHESSCITKPAALIGDQDQIFSNNNGSLRSSWVQRKSKDIEVDVRIVDDEVTIKFVQRKKMNRLLCVSKVLDELQLDLHHVAGGHVGDYFSFLFNTKINEGSFVYASAVANRIMEMVEGPINASTPSTGCYN